MDIGMDKDTLARLNNRQKKELLGTLLSSLLDDLNEIEKRDLILTVVSSSGENPQAIDMVDH